MFKNAMVGVDGKQGGRDATRLASMLVAAGGQITLAHVDAQENGRRAAAETAHELLAETRGREGRGALKLNVVCPNVGLGLQRLALEHDCDLVVVGSCSRGPVGRILIGDDTRETLNESECPVAIAPEGYGGEQQTIASIAVGYESEAQSGKALSLARMLAAERSAKLTALTVLDPAENSERDIDGLLELAQAHLDELDGAHGLAVLGDVGEELAGLNAAVDLLVVGSRGKGAIGGVLAKSVLHDLIEHLHSPLLVQPNEASPPASPVALNDADAAGERPVERVG